MIKIEFDKVKRVLPLIIFIMIIPLIINVLLTVDLQFRYDYLLLQKDEIGFSFWQLIYKEQNIFYINEILPIFCTLFAYILFSIEVKNNAWINTKILCKRIDKTVLSKFLVMIIICIITIVICNISLIPVGRITGVETSVEWGLIFKAIAAQIIASIPVMAFGILVIALAKKVIYVIPVAIFIFFISLLFLQGTGGVLEKVNPFLFATKCYIQEGKTIVHNLIVALIWIGVCIPISLIVMNKKDELEQRI